ncbi:hypothetical protein BK022_23750 [Methylorubrum extorquens]|uniref:Uncharacterized protein n=1 Tax=Methylorubrum extorquens TaxID=408 RepID=A0A1S1P0I8_METEX|nr:hypothetical protein BK022_23750 [Methylorubrum extorquens]
MARAASALSPTTRRIRPALVLRNAHHRNTASAAPARNSTLTRNAAWTCGRSDQKPKGIAGSGGAEGWMKGFPRKKARPEPNSISAMPIATSLTRGKRQMKPCSRPKAPPARPATATPAHALPLSTAVA